MLVTWVFGLIWNVLLSLLKCILLTSVYSCYWNIDSVIITVKEAIVPLICVALEFLSLLKWLWYMKEYTHTVCVCGFRDHLSLTYLLTHTAHTHTHTHTHSHTHTHTHSHTHTHTHTLTHTHTHTHTHW